MVKVTYERLEKHIDAIYACQRCGWCRTATYYDKGIERICPIFDYHQNPGWDWATARGRLAIIRGLIEGRLEMTPEVAEVLFMCPTCANCKEICSANVAYDYGVEKKPKIEHVKIYEDMRAELVNKYPDLVPVSHKRFLAYIKEYHNPYKETHAKRFAWVPGEIANKGELVYFAGCTAPYRQPEVSESTVKILKALGVDFAILGENEWCCGSPIIRTGQYDYAKELVKHNLDALKSTGGKTVVTSCAGCYRTLKVDYAEILGKELDLEILHTSELLAKLLKEGKLKYTGEFPEKVTYHDPCHLGRHAGVYNEPREVLRSIPGIEFVEMYPTGRWASCCGAGGGMKAGFGDLAIKIAIEKLHKVRETGANIIVSTCPFCKRNFDDAIKAAASDIKFYDLTEILAKII
ncbi:MAG: (Fe-S)-binding protein [Candidatus Hodarchaeota archaeon]